MNESMWNQVEDPKMDAQKSEESVATRAAKDLVYRLGLFSNSTTREVIVKELAKEFEKYPNKLAVAEAARVGFGGT